MNSGDVADFSNCKFFITGDTLEEKSMGFAGGQSPPKSKIRVHLSKYFSSNIFLEELTERDLRRVLWSKLKNMSDILSMNNIKLIYDFKFIKNFVQGVDFKNNALQSLNDAFDKKIKQSVAKESLSGEGEIHLKKLSTKKLK
jgi:ATP-dependent Clp protease ATP-binding subunit ClpA